MGDGADTLDDAARRLAKKNPKKYAAAVKAIKDIPPPPALAHILVWYLELRAQNVRGWQFEPVAYSELLAYLTLHGLEYDSFDVGAVLQLDQIWMSVQPKPDKKGNNPGRNR